MAFVLQGQDRSYSRQAGICARTESRRNIELSRSKPPSAKCFGSYSPNDGSAKEKTDPAQVAAGLAAYVYLWHTSTSGLRLLDLIMASKEMASDTQRSVGEVCY